MAEMIQEKTSLHYAGTVTNDCTDQGSYNARDRSQPRLEVAAIRSGISVLGRLAQSSSWVR